MIASLTLAVALAAPAAAPKPGVRPLPAVIDPAANAAAPRVLDLKPDADGKVRVTVTRMEKQKVTIGVGGGPAPADDNAAPARPPIVREFTAPKEVRVELSEVKDLVVTTADGKAIDTKDALKKLADGGAVIATANGKPVDPKFLKALRDDTLVLVSPELVVGHAAAGFGGNGGVIILDNGVMPLPAPAPGVPVKPIARPLPKPIVRPLPAPVPGVQLPEKE